MCAGRMCARLVRGWYPACLFVLMAAWGRTQAVCAGRMCARARVCELCASCVCMCVCAVRVVVVVVVAGYSRSGFGFCGWVLLLGLGLAVVAALWRGLSSMAGESSLVEFR